MSSGVLPQEISASRKIYPNRASLGDSIALAAASQRVPLILAVAEVAKYIPLCSGIQKWKFGQWQDDQICAVFSNSHVFVVFRYSTVQYAIWYALQMSSLVRVTAAFCSQNAVVTRTVRYHTELRNVISYQRTVRFLRTETLPI